MSIVSRLSLLNFQWELLTGLYMLQPWEKFAFNSFVLLVLLGSVRIVAHSISQLF